MPTSGVTLGRYPRQAFCDVSCLLLYVCLLLDPGNVCRFSALVQVAFVCGCPVAYLISGACKAEANASKISRKRPRNGPGEGPGAARGRPGRLKNEPGGPRTPPEEAREAPKSSPGALRAGQKVVWKSRGPVRSALWSRFSPPGGLREVSGRRV